MQFLQKRRVLLVLSAFVAINFTNCSKDDTEKLTDGVWSLAKINDTDIEVFYSTLTGGAITSAEVTLDFEEDGDYTYSYTYVDEGITEVDVYNGTWEWETADEETLVLTEDDGYVQKFEVKELTKSKMILNSTTSNNWEMEFEK